MNLSELSAYLHRELEACENGSYNTLIDDTPTVMGSFCRKLLVMLRNTEEGLLREPLQSPETQLRKVIRGLHKEKAAAQRLLNYTQFDETRDRLLGENSTLERVIRYLEAIL